MVFSEEDRVLNKVLHQEKDFGAKNFIKKFPNKNWSLSSLKKLLTKIDQTGSFDHKPGSGKKRTIWIAQDVDSDEELVLSQESAPGTHKTIRRLQKRLEFPKQSCSVVKTTF